MFEKCVVLPGSPFQQGTGDVQAMKKAILTASIVEDLTPEGKQDANILDFCVPLQAREYISYTR